MAVSICLAAIVAAILAGWKFNLNFGIISLAFAFVIGSTVLGLKASQIIDFWPTSIVFYIMSISLFFNYAMDNKTMELLGRKMLYAMKGNAKMIPFVIMLVATVVSLLGAGPSTAAIVGSFSFAMATAAGIHPVLVAIILVTATFFGADNPFNGYGGVISMGLIEQLGYEDAFGMSMRIWGFSVLKGVIVILGSYVIFRGYKAKPLEMEKPGAFSPVQKKTLVLVLAVFATMVIPTALNTFIGGAFLSRLAQLCQPQSVMVIAAVIAALLKLGDEAVILRKQNISTIFTIAGVSMLLSVAAEAGLVEWMADILGGSFPPVLIGPIFALFGGFLNLFASGAGVVCPLLYPLAVPLAESLGLNPTMLFASIFIGTMSTSIAPFSAGGAIIIASCDDPDKQASLTRTLIPAALGITIVSAVLSLVGIFNL